MDLISVIVPIYKVEKYLNRCIQSIVDQTYQNLEIILVDDGSPDNCPVMCDAWAAKDSRIKVIHQENSGGGAARNTALDASQGELIAFVDSDDYIAPDMFEHLYGLMEQGAEIAECGHMDVLDDHASFWCTDFDVHTYTVQEAMAEHIRDRIFRQLIWNKLYRRDIIGEIRFPVGKKIDDEFFTYRVLGNAEKLIRSDKICYAYRQQEDSVMHSMRVAKRMQGVEAKAQRHKYIEKCFPDLVGLSCRGLWFSCLYHGQMALREMENPKDSMDFLRDIMRKNPIVLDGCAVKEKLWLTMTKVSFENTCRVRNFLKIGL